MGIPLLTLLVGSGQLGGAPSLPLPLGSDISNCTVAVACCGCEAQHLKELHGHGTLVVFVLGILWGPALDEETLALL